MHADFFLLAAGRPPLPAAVVRRGVGRNGGTPAALRDDVTAHYAPLPAVASAEFIDIVTFRGLPTYRVTLTDGDGSTTTAYYLMRRLDDGSLRIAGCVLVRVPSS